MGFGLPAAVGAVLESPDQPACLFVGDGGMQVNIQELETLKMLGSNVLIVVLNNLSQGMVRQFQDSYYGGRHYSTVLGYSSPNFESIAYAYGLKATTIASVEEIEGALVEISAFSGPALLQVMLSPNLNAFPKLEHGANLDSMSPPIDE